MTTSFDTTPLDGDLTWLEAYGEARASTTWAQGCADCPELFADRRNVQPAPILDYDPRLYWQGGGGRGVRARCCRAPEPQPKKPSRLSQLKEKVFG